MDLHCLHHPITDEFLVFDSINGQGIWFPINQAFYQISRKEKHEIFLSAFCLRPMKCEICDLKLTLIAVTAVSSQRNNSSLFGWRDVQSFANEQREDTARQSRKNRIDIIRPTRKWKSKHIASTQYKCHMWMLTSNNYLLNFTPSSDTLTKSFNYCII